MWCGYNSGLKNTPDLQDMMQPHQWCANLGTSNPNPNSNPPPFPWIRIQIHPLFLESESKSNQSFFSNPNPDSCFLGLNPNPNPAQKALDPDSNPNPESDSHITDPHAKAWGSSQILHRIQDLFIPSVISLYHFANKHHDFSKKNTPYFCNTDLLFFPAISLIDGTALVGIEWPTDL